MAVNSKDYVVGIFTAKYRQAHNTPTLLVKLVKSIRQVSTNWSNCELCSENLLTVSFVVIFDDSSYALQITHYKPIIPSKFHCSTYLASLTPIFPPKNKPINSNYVS